MTIVSYEAGRFAIVGKVERIEAMIDRERVSWFVRRIVQPPERPDDPLPENIVGSAYLVSTRHCAICCPTESCLLPIIDLIGSPSELLRALVPAIGGCMDLPEIRCIIREWAEGTPQIEAVRIFGSRAKETARPDSDLDLAITASNGNYVALADRWEAHLRLVTGLFVKLHHYNTGELVRAYCDDFSIMIFSRS